MKTKTIQLKQFSERAKQLIFEDNHRRLSGLSRVLPNFLIVGTQKAGTTSLYHYLKQHPQVRNASQN